MPIKSLIQESLHTIGLALNLPVEGIGWRCSNGDVFLLDSIGTYFVDDQVRNKLRVYLSHKEHLEQAIHTILPQKLGWVNTHDVVILPTITASHDDEQPPVFGLTLALPLNTSLTETQWQIVNNIAQLTAKALYGMMTLKDSRRRQVRLEAAATVGRDATILMDPDELLDRVAHRISEQFNFYHTGIFLVDDEGEHAVLRATNSPYGRQLIAHNHRLKIGEQGMVGYVTGTGEARIAPDVGTDSTHYVNPFLPNTRSEITLPMHYGDQVIGALDVQSKEAGVFTEDDCTTLQIMADQLANALVNARLHDEARQRLNETRLLRDVMAHASALSWQEVLDKAAKILRDALPFPYQAFFEQHADCLQTTPGSTWPQTSYPLNATPLAAIWDSNKVWRTTSAAKLQWIGGQHIAAMSAVPIHENGKTLALFAIATCTSGQIRPRDQHFLEALAAQLSILLQNAQNYEAMARGQNLLQQLITAGEEMTRAQEVPAILDILCSTLLNEIRGTIEIALYGHEHHNSAEKDAIKSGADTEIASTLVLPIWTVQRTNPENTEPQYLSSYFDANHVAQPITRPYHFDLNEAQAREDIRLRHPQLGEQLAALPYPHILVQPLITVERPIGVIVLTLDTPLNNHLAEHISWIQAMANQTSLILNNAQLITQLKKQTQQLRQAYERAQHLNEVRAQMVQNVSHELRTPLGIILGYAGMLSEQTLGELNPQQQEIANTILTRSQTLHRMIQNLTSLQGRIQLKNVAPVALPDLIERVIQEYHEIAEEQSVRFVVECNPGMPFIPGDSEQLHLAIAHLVENAIKFSPEGGNVLIRLWPDTHWGYFTISDQGIGIATEHLDRIFERFYQVDGSTTRRFGGMGIGLALVWDIIEAHHGQIQVHSSEGEGSTFLIALPREYNGSTGVIL